MVYNFINMCCLFSFGPSIYIFYLHAIEWIFFRFLLSSYYYITAHFILLFSCYLMKDNMHYSLSIVKGELLFCNCYDNARALKVQIHLLSPNFCKFPHKS